jgi:hypothetical protein
MNTEKLTLEIGKRLNALGWIVLNDCASGEPTNVEQCEQLHRAVKGAIEVVGEQPESVNGVPLWDWYAGQALNGLLAQPQAEPHLDYSGEAAVYATRMMQARKGEE